MNVYLWCYGGPNLIYRGLINMPTVTHHSVVLQLLVARVTSTYDYFTPIVLVSFRIETN